MNHKEFTYWLEGFLAGKQDLDEAQITRIKEAMKEIEPGPSVQRVTQYPISDPNTFPKWQEPHKMNPTCDTGKQLLNDSTSEQAKKLVDSKYKSEF